MASVVEICNLALSSLGKGVPISALDEASEEARQCKQHYGFARDWLLQQFEYQFARKVLALASLSNDWDERWGYRYSKPNDCLKIIRIVPPIDDADDLPIPYGVRGASVYTDDETAKLEYTFRQEGRRPANLRVRLWNSRSIDQTRSIRRCSMMCRRRCSGSVGSISSTALALLGCSEPMQSRKTIGISCAGPSGG